ncbi:MAG: hypothetical protein EXS03_02320 [Phycisphaerales bacterium]|nr:hypothetical protein [Phycisphaerales bacterium]
MPRCCLPIVCAAATALAGVVAQAAPPVQKAKLVASDGQEIDNFGRSTSLTSLLGTAGATPDLAASGIPYDIVGTVVNKGSVNVYKRSAAGLWVFEAKLTAADGAANDFLGASVAAFGDTIIVGSPGDDNGTTIDQGSAYIFKRSASGTWSQAAKLLATDGAAGDSFGYSVSLTNTVLTGATIGDLAVVGAWSDDFSTLTDQGSAYAFKRSTAGTWSQEGKFFAAAADGAAGEYYGTAVSVHGDRATIGCPGDDIAGAVDRGSAYIWKRATTGAWSQEAKIVAADGAVGDFCGNAIAISGDYTMVGAPGDDFSAVGDRGSAYVFLRSGTATWTQQAKLIAADGLINDIFGSAVAIDGTRAIIAAPYDDGTAGGGGTSYTNIGAAYLFERTGTVWAEKARFNCADGQAEKYFGTSAAIWGGYGIVGSPADDIGSPLRQDQGSAYIFELVPTDCNGNGIPDAEDIASGIAQDCNANLIPDSCDIASGTSTDVDGNAVPDSCQTDCNDNDIPDLWEIAHGTVRDCNANLVPDSCDIASGAADTDADGRIDACERALGDFDLNGQVDGIDMALILSAWGTNTPAYADLDGNGSIGGGDLTGIFSRWGTLP